MSWQRRWETEAVQNSVQSEAVQMSPPGLPTLLRNYLPASMYIHIHIVITIYISTFFSVFLRGSRSSELASHRMLHSIFTIHNLYSIFYVIYVYTCNSICNIHMQYTYAICISIYIYTVPVVRSVSIACMWGLAQRRKCYLLPYSYLLLVYSIHQYTKHKHNMHQHATSHNT